MGPIHRATFDAARRGDRDAFEQIIRMHFRTAYVVALAIVGDPVDAEDVVQDSFVRCWQRLDQCRGPGSLSSWIRSVVRSVAMNYLEREAVRTTADLDRCSVPSRESPSLDLERQELRRRLTDAMAHLTPSQREVLLLYDLEGFRHAEIAELLEISELVSRRHLSNARSRMRRALEDPDAKRATQ